MGAVCGTKTCLFPDVNSTTTKFGESMSPHPTNLITKEITFKHSQFPLKRTDILEETMESIQSSEMIIKQSDNNNNNNNNINNDTTNPLCYCGEALKSDDDEFERDWQCKHCFQNYDKTTAISYWCLTGKACKYNQLTNSFYNICQQCYDAIKTHEKHIKYTKNIENMNINEKGQFILNKIRSQIEHIQNNIIPNNQQK
eukprot:198635_1